MAVFRQGFITDIRLFCQNAEAAAGGIHQDAVRCGELRIWPRRVVAKGFDVCKAHPLHRRPNKPDAVFRRVAADESTGTLHLLGQQDGLAAGSRAEVQHRFAGLCLHAEGGQLAGLTFHVVAPRPEQVVVGGAALKFCEDAARHDARLGRSAQRVQLFAEGGHIGLEGVRPEARSAAVCRVGQDAQRFVRVAAAEKLRHVLPCRTQHHEPFGLILELGLAQVVDTSAAQHRIDQPRRAGFFEGAGQLDGLVDRRRHRHLHIAGLCQRRTQDLPDRRIQLGKALGQELR